MVSHHLHCSCALECKLFGQDWDGHLGRHQQVGQLQFSFFLPPPTTHTVRLRNMVPHSCQETANVENNYWSLSQSANCNCCLQGLNYDQHFSLQYLLIFLKTGKLTWGNEKHLNSFRQKLIHSIKGSRQKKTCRFWGHVLIRETTYPPSLIRT